MSIDGRFMQCVELVMGLKRFLWITLLPKIGYKFYDGVKDVAEGVMKEACNEVRSLSAGYTEEDDSNIKGTGTWQKRGFTRITVLSWQYQLIRGKF